MMIGAHVLQVVLAIAIAPLLAGISNHIHARLLGREGPSIWQPGRDIWKLLHKQTIVPDNWPALRRAAPTAVFALSWIMAVLVPAFATDLFLLRGSNVFFLLALMAAIHLVLIRVAMEAGRHGEGLASWQPAVVRAFVLLVLAWLAVWAAGTSQLPGMAVQVMQGPASTWLALTLAALAMVLCVADQSLSASDLAAFDYSGRDLALIRMAAALRLTAYLSLFACAVVPFGIVTGPLTWPAIAVGTLVYLLKVVLLAVARPVADMAVARLWLLHHPAYLGAAAAVAAIAVIYLKAMWA